MTNATVALDDRTPLEFGLKKLKARLLKGGVLRELRARASYMKPGDRKRMKSRRVRRNRRTAALKAERADALHGERLAWQKTNPERRR